ncbi:hypothetical protein Tsubulata_017734 [Turnera subulata]|uniref:DUF4283 domain-containing protein n=1 Tax=Turnera subulata TaxID=218843 RepID=A0A9Q0JME2_9ROSI|nr:hypothetical protein Tsubulata_017734 [Turnera subulata]
MKVVDLDNDFFLVRLDCEEDYFKALAGGPWVIMRHALSVQPWDSSFRAAEGQISQAVIWARFADFPPSWYNTEVLHALGSLVGGPMKVDDNTKAALRGKFARVAVEVNLKRPLRGIVEFDDTEFKVSYEGLLAICYTCGSVCHTMASCPTNRPLATNEGASSSRPAPGSTGVGDWMNVPQRGRRRPRQEAASPSNRPPIFESPRRAVFQGRAAPEGEPKVIASVFRSRSAPRPSTSTSAQAPAATVASVAARQVSHSILSVISSVIPPVSASVAPAITPVAPSSTYTATVLPPQTNQRVYNMRSSSPPVSHEMFAEPPPISAPPLASGISRVPVSPTKPPNLNLVSRFTRTPEKNKKKQSATLPLKKPTLKVSALKKLGLHLEEGQAASRKLKGPRSSGVSSSS